MEEPLREGDVALHLGCGGKLWPGWVNVDGFDGRADVKADLLTLPFPDNHADRVASIHVFEHFYPWDAKRFLAECKRVLKPGGSIVLEMPCMDKVFGHIVGRMQKGEAPSPTFSWFAIWGDPRYERPEMLHRWGYFKVDLDMALKDAGFVNVVHEEPRYHFPIRDMRISANKEQA